MQVCVSIPADCSVCYPATASCGGVVTLLIPLYGMYYLWVRDKFLNLYSYQTMIYGTVAIDQTQFPQGFFSNTSGAFDIFFTTDSLGLNVAPFSISMMVYNCVLLTIE